MKQVLLSLLYWCYIQPSASLPVEDKPGFTLWKKASVSLSSLEFSGLKDGTSMRQLGIFDESHFGIPDPTCRGRLEPGGKCWDMDQFTVAKMIEARTPEANNCKASCLFYTEKLSGGAERTANYVLWNQLAAGAIEGDRKYQTIWGLHDKKYYPSDWRNGEQKEEFLDDTPETKCAYQDRKKDDEREKFIGCQRRYFMSMSKAMAAECEGVVYLMTRADLKNEEELVKTPENGIWWQVEFPSLLDESRAGGRKITKIIYIQVKDLSKDEFEVLKNLPDDQKTPPDELGRGEYWPEGPGKRHLDDWNKGVRVVMEEASQQKRSPDEFNAGAGKKEDSQQKRSPAIHEFVTRADSNSGADKVCMLGDDCYPYPYRMNDMYDMYKDVVW